MGPVCTQRRGHVQTSGSTRLLSPPPTLSSLSPGKSGEMAEHHHLHLSSPESSPFLGLQLTSPSGFSRLSNDISLEEFEDEDFSEIVDDCGITAPCLSDLAGSQQVVGSLVEHLQEDLLELELIDAEDDEFETEELGQSSAKTSIHGVCHHVPQDTLNNNNCGPKKSTWQDKVRSSSPLRNGFHSPSHLCLKEQQQQQAALAGDRQASSNLNSSSNHNGPAVDKYSGTGMENLAYGSLWRAEASHRAVSGREEPVVRGAPPGSAELVREAPPGSSRPAREDPPGMAESVLLAPLGRDEPDGETETARDASTRKDEEDDDEEEEDDEEAEAEDDVDDDDDEEGAVKEHSAEYFTVLQRKAREQPSLGEGQQQQQHRPSCVGVLEEDPQWASLELLPVQGDGRKEAKSPGATLPESKATETRGEPCALRQMAAAGGGRRPTRCSDSSALSYESVRYMLVMDEHTKLEMSALSPPRIASGPAEEGGGGKRGGGTPVPPDFASPRDAETFRRHEAACFSDTTCSSPESEFPFSKKFLNVFMNGATRSSSTESFGLFSCVIDGEEREQTHRAVFRFVPRHPDEVPMDVDDPLYVERQADDFWCEGYNMRTGEHGVFPAYYAHAVSQDPEDVYGKSRNDDWVERFGLHFLGSVEVPYHKGNNVLCAAMQKIAQARRVTVHLKPPSVCTLEITAQGIRLVLKAGSYQGGKCSHFFKLRNVSFCGYHPKKSNYFGFITKHPSDHRFACHVFVAEDSTRPVAESVGKAFQVFYKEYLEYACPTEDIYLE
ncbi:C-Jun-amino-terminal kinase-interacting protein 1-like isoform X2 [Lampetra fluviatilis]